MGVLTPTVVLDIFIWGDLINLSILTFKKQWKEKVEADIMIIQNAIFDPWSKQQIHGYHKDLVHFFCLPSLTFLAIFSYFFLLSFQELQILTLYREFERFINF